MSAYPILKQLRSIITPENRLQVDVGSSGLGVRYRFFYEYSIPAGESRWIRIVFPTDVTVTQLSANNDDGFLRIRSYRGATDNGPWSAPATPTSGLFASNNEGGAGGSPASTVEIGGNGAAVPETGIVSLVDRIRSSTGNKTSNSVGRTITDELVAAAGTYHVQLESLESTTPEGVFYLSFEERTV